MIRQEGCKTFCEDSLEEIRPRILNAASDLFSEFGYAGTTMSMLAVNSGVSEEMLKAEFPEKQQILNELIGFHIDVLEGIRAFTRNNPELSPLKSMLREWELMCEYMDNYRGTLQAYNQNRPIIAPWIGDRVNHFRSQDIELLEKACALKELPQVNAASLEAVLYGTLWGLIQESVQEQGGGNLTVIPGRVSSIVLEPLMHSSGISAS